MMMGFFDRMKSLIDPEPRVKPVPGDYNATLLEGVIEKVMAKVRDAYQADALVSLNNMHGDAFRAKADARAALAKEIMDAYEEAMKDYAGEYAAKMFEDFPDDL